ncbi:MAG: hypothetical protein U0930_14920 [Pirellulales bacterium]
MMTLSIQSFAAVTSALAIVASIVSFPGFGIAALLIIPMIVLGIALSSPQKGTQLDPTGSWTCKFLTKTWLFSIAFLICGVITLILFPNLGARVSRMMTTGDMRAYRVPILLQIPSSATAKLDGKTTWMVSDQSGKFVGELRHVHTRQALLYSPMRLAKPATLGFLSTDRSEYNGTYESGKEFAISIGEDDNVILKPAPQSLSPQSVP